jgi:hypothetical protein
MPKFLGQDLAGVALAIAIPLIPGLAFLTSPQPPAPGCATARCSAVPATAESIHPQAASLVLRAGFLLHEPVRPAAFPAKHVAAPAARPSAASPPSIKEQGN